MRFISGIIEPISQDMDLIFDESMAGLTQQRAATSDADDSNNVQTVDETEQVVAKSSKRVKHPGTLQLQGSFQSHVQNMLCY